MAAPPLDSELQQAPSALAIDALLDAVSQHRVEALATRKGWTIPNTIRRSELAGSIIAGTVVDGFVFLELSASNTQGLDGFSAEHQAIQKT